LNLFADAIDLVCGIRTNTHILFEESLAPLIVDNSERKMESKRLEVLGGEMIQKSEPSGDEVIGNSDLKKILILLKDYFSRVKLDSEQKTITSIATLLASSQHHLVEQELVKSKNKAEFYRLIEKAVLLSHGPNYVFTVHGVYPSLGNWKEDRLQAVFRAIGEFQNKLSNELHLGSFISSGTLLGFVREGKVIANDDDFDLYYVSNEVIRPNILLERFELKRWIEEALNFEVRESTGGHFHVFSKTKTFTFMFDLFVGWIEEGRFFNVYPLEPNKIEIADIRPIRIQSFYGASVHVPCNPEPLLELNYGPGWRQPDPTWRLDWASTALYYRFLTGHKLSSDLFVESTSIKEYIPIVCGRPIVAKETNFLQFKQDALLHAATLTGRQCNLLVCGAISRELIEWLDRSNGQYDRVDIVDDLTPNETNFHSFQSGEVTFNRDIEKLPLQKCRLLVESTRDVSCENLRKQLGVAYDVVFFDTINREKTLDYLFAIKNLIAPSAYFIFDDYLLESRGEINKGPNAALWDFINKSGIQVRFIGRSAWSQVIVHVEREREIVLGKSAH
jgi:hypothetical protein